MQQALHHGHRADQSQQRCQYLLALLIVGFWVGLLDWRFSLFGLLVLCTLSPLVVHSSRFDITIAAQSGKYIPGEVAKDADALQDVRQRLVSAREQRSNELLAMVPRQQSASQPLLSKPRATPERGSGSKKQLAMILRPRSAVSKVQAPPDAAALIVLPKVGLVPSSSSTFPLLIGNFSSDSLPMPLVQFLNTRKAPSFSTPSLYQTPFSFVDPCPVEPVPLSCAATASPVVSPSSEDSTMTVVTMGQENQAAGEIQLNQMHQDQHTLSTGTQSVEEPVNGQTFVEVEDDSVGQPEVQSIEVPTRGQASKENEDSRETEPETIEKSTDSQTSVGPDNDGPLQIVPQEIDTPAEYLTSEAVIDKAVQAEAEAIETPIDVHASGEAKDNEAFRIEPEAIETPAGCQLSPSATDDNDLRIDGEMLPEPFSRHFSDEEKNVRDLKLESGPIGLVSDSQHFNEEEDEKGDFNVPLSGSDVVLDPILNAQDINELGDSQSRLSIATGNRRSASKEDVGIPGS